MSVPVELCSSVARAAPPDDLSAHLEVESEPACVAQDRLESRVRQRSQRLRFVEASPDVTSLRVRVAPQAGSTLAVELQVTRPGGRRSVRWLRARSCDDALEATALVIAITLDESASTEELPAPDAASSAATSVSPEAPPSSVGAASVPSTAPHQAATVGGVQKSERAGEWRFQPGVGLAGHAIGGPAPQVLAGIGAFALFRWERSGFSPGLRVALVHYFRASVEEAAGTATFGAEALSLDLCPFGLRTGAVALRACAAASALVLSAHGGNTFSPRSRTRPYVALGGSLLGNVELGRRFGLVASAAFGKNLVLDRFAFSPSIFYRVPSFGWDAAAGFEFRFP